jgi:hypothetical protein
MVAHPGPRRYDFGMSDATPAEASEVDLASIENLRQYWTVGAGARRIRWGTEGDLTRCHRLVMQEAGGDLTDDQAWGFCNNLHKRLFGVPNDPDD